MKNTLRIIVLYINYIFTILINIITNLYSVVPLSMSMTPCRKIKKVKHSHYTIKNRVVTYTCKEGYQQKGRVNQYTCDSYSGKWNNVNMECKSKYFINFVIVDYNYTCNTHHLLYI